MKGNVLETGHWEKHKVMSDSRYKQGKTEALKLTLIRNSRKEHVLFSNDSNLKSFISQFTILFFIAVSSSNAKYFHTITE